MTRLTLGFVPLVDCAPLVIARELGFAAEEGLTIDLVPQPSWSALRDMVALGHLEAAQMLAPLPLAMSMGMGGMAMPMDALMVLSVNGTVFGVSRAVAARLAGQGVEGLSAPRALAAGLAATCPDGLRVGVPFPFSMHRLLLHYWHRNAGEFGGLAIEDVTIPPPRMADAMAAGEIDAFWVGEPWGTEAVSRDIAELMLTGPAVWSFAPEKVLAARHDWVEANPGPVCALMRAVHHAARWLETPANAPLAVEILARSEHLDLADRTIDPALTGHIRANGRSLPQPVNDFLLFNRKSAAFPWRSQAAWIAAQLGADAEASALAQRSFRADLYRQNLGPIGVDLPGASEKVEGTMRHATAVSSTRGHMILGPDVFFDGKTFDSAPKV